MEGGGGWRRGVEGCGRMGVLFYSFMHSDFEVLDLFLH